jgi:hypothetical protein
MKAVDQRGYLVAFALGAGGTLLGYYVPIVGVVLTVCLLLVVVAALLGDAGGAMADLIARPFTALGRWLAQKDDSRWLRRAPFIGLVAGWILRWVANGLTASGGA